MRPEVACQWLAREALSSQSIDQYATVRSALSYFLTTKLAPLLAHVLAGIDRFANLDTLISPSSNGDEWKRSMWMHVAGNSALFRVDYAGMRVTDDEKSNRQLDTFVCQSDWFVIATSDGSSHRRRIQSSLPFCWLLYEQIEHLRAANSATATTTTTTRMFAETSWAKFLVWQVLPQSKQRLFDDYLHDFLLISCPLIRTRGELSTIWRLMRANVLSHSIGACEDETLATTTSTVTKCMPLLHDVFERERTRVDMFLRFCRFDQDTSALNGDNYDDEDESTMPMHIDSTQISMTNMHLRACLACIDRFKRSFNAHTCITRLFSLIQLVAELCVDKSTAAESSELEELTAMCVEQHEALIALRLFVDNVTTPLTKKRQSSEQTNKLSTQLIADLNKQCLEHNVNFGGVVTMRALHEFIASSGNHLRQLRSSAITSSDIDHALAMFYAVSLMP
jgi:hypothetical protein